VVREGSVASHPSAYILDTGEELKAQEMSGAEMMATSRSGLAEDLIDLVRAYLK